VGTGSPATTAAADDDDDDDALLTVPLLLLLLIPGLLELAAAQSPVERAAKFSTLCRSAGDVTSFGDTTGSIAVALSSACLLLLLL
jgi:hypothetical protein